MCIRDRGTLLIIKNYSGDMMNFKNAAHLAEEDGIQVDYVKVDDDIAVKDSLYTVGRRGVAGTVLVHKIAGAAAEKGGSLKQVKTAAENAISNVRSIGFALSSCTVPAKGDVYKRQVFHYNTKVVNIEFDVTSDRKQATRIEVETEGETRFVDLTEDDLVFITNGGCCLLYTSRCV